MNQLKEAKEPFKFMTRLNLSELTGLRASTLSSLLNLIKSVSGASIYHHTHRFLQQHQYLSPEPPNDFAYWVNEVLGEEKLGEQLASINIIEFATIKELREKIAITIEEYLKDNPSAKLRFASQGEEFYFIKSVSFIAPTHYTVNNLREFIDVFEKITPDSFYFHIFEARLRLEKPTNDFSNWIENSIGDQILARQISAIDPYTYTMEGLRRKIISLIEKRING